MREIELRRLKHLCMKRASDYQEKADKWKAKAEEYNDIVVKNWLKRMRNTKPEAKE